MTNAKRPSTRFLPRGGGQAMLKNAPKQADKRCEEKLGKRVPVNEDQRMVAVEECPGYGFASGEVRRPSTVMSMSRITPPAVSRTPAMNSGKGKMARPRM